VQLIAQRASPVSPGIPYDMHRITGLVGRRGQRPLLQM